MVAITENWLREGVLDGELFPQNYAVYREDRSTGTRGGGVLLAVNSDEYNSEIYEIDCPIQKIDVLAVKISGANYIPVIILLVYIPPNISMNEYD